MTPWAIAQRRRRAKFYAEGKTALGGIRIKKMSGVPVYKPKPQKPLPIVEKKWRELRDTMNIGNGVGK